jgi:hypothetical protein
MAYSTKTRHQKLSRRTFLKYAAGAGVLLGGSPLLQLPESAQAARPQKPHLESRTYLFNLSHMDTSVHDVILVAGTQRLKLKRVTPGVRRKARRDHPILQYVPDAHLTHHFTLDMPADAIQLCYLQRVARGKKDGSWDMALLFCHLPVSALRHARQRGLLQAERGLPKVHVKWQRYGLTPDDLAALNDPVGEAMLQDTTDQATTLVAGHPELTSGEPNSAAHIQNNIIGVQSTTQVLGQVIAAQGPATPDGGWATQTPLINDDTGQPYLNSLGQIQYVPVWSQETAQFAGQAISPALDTAKDDTTLGVNITTIDPTTITDNDPTAPTNGAIWTVQDGMPTVDQSSTAALAATVLPYQFSNQTPGHGYSVAISQVSGDGNGNISLAFTAKNSFVRYLSLYIRYLDGNNQPIPLTQIENEIRNGFRDWDLGQNGAYDAYLQILNPQWNFFGIPCKTTTATYTIPVPAEAASILILGGGLGSGDNPYPDTITPGVVMTAMYNLSVPSLMLGLGAAAGYASLAGELQGAALLAQIIPLIVQLFADLAIDLTYNDPSVFNSLVAGWAAVLLKSAAAPLVQPVAEAIAEGETVQAVLDAIPFAGAAMSAIFAIGLITQLAETSAQVAQSPRAYIDKIALTHDVAVTIFHDPTDPAGFPAVADFFTVTALFDGGSPQVITQDLPGTTVTAPITVTFADVPAGGQVKVDVGFYSGDQWLAGQGSVGPVANTATMSTLPLEITITENLVPLTSATQYSHKEIIVLDSSGNHQWQGTTTPPSVVTPQGLCENVNGHICSLTGITVSTINASVGYAWQAYNTAVPDCVSGGLGQLHQFANISVTQNPQSGYLFSECGFSGVTRIVYDLLGKEEWNFYLDPTNNNNFIRQIRLSAGGASSYDSPTSNKAFGQLQFPSDALLLHPLGKIVSINTSLSKLEVLDLPPAAVADADAPLSQVRSGFGTREGLMDGPIHAALTAQGAILILEQNNNRIQAFDLGGNPVPYFANGAYFVPLIDPAGTAVYLDLAVEYSGYLYVLSYTGSGPFTYHLDLYTPDGVWLARTTGVNADKLAVNYWRDLFTLNYQVLTLPSGAFPDKTEPSVSHWIPSTP